mgnify:CR=1 FL=1
MGKQDKEAVNIYFGQTIKRVLEAKKISQAKFAKLNGFDANSVRKWTNGHVMPSVFMMLRICDALDVSPNDLFGYDGNENLSLKIAKRKIKNALKELNEGLKEIDEETEFNQANQNPASKEKEMRRPRGYLSTKTHFQIDGFGKIKCGKVGRKTKNLDDVDCLACLKKSKLNNQQKARLEARILFRQHNFRKGSKK